MTAAKNSSNRNQQCKKWEKDRRDRLKDSFNDLAKLLPCYEPSSTISKIDILTKSAEYIIKLQTKATSDDANQHKSDDIKELQVRIVHLTSRNEQLSNLLRDANITIPTECGERICEKAKKWTGKITPEKADEISKCKLQKENKNAEANLKVSTGKVKGVQLQEKKKKARRKAKTGKIPPIPPVNNLVTPLSGPSTLTITNVQPMQPYYIIANNIASTITTQATTVKNMITTPILSTTNQPNKSFTRGIILPVVQPQTLLNPPLFLNAVNAVNGATPTNTLFVVKAKTDVLLPNLKPLQTSAKITNINKNGTSTSSQKTQKKLALLRPKRRVITRIGNKLPIPSSRYDASSFILWPSYNEPQVSVKKRTRIVKRKRKKVDGTNGEGKDEVTAKKVKKTELVGADEGAAKKQSSDYSINAICKESETPTIKDIEKVINEVVEKANPPNEASKETNAQLTVAIATKTNEDQQICAGASVGVVKDVQKQVIIKDVTINQNPVQSLQNNPKHFQGQTKDMKNMNHLQANQMLPLQGQYQNQNTTQSQQELNAKQNQIQLQSSHSQPQQMLHQHQQELHLHSELSNDIFASLQVQGSQNPESTSPTAAFLNAFPLVSSFTGVKVTEVLEEETTDSPHGTPTLLQIGNLEATQKATNAHQIVQNIQSNADNLTPSIINLDNFNFFNNNLYNSFDNGLMIGTSVTSANVPVSVSQSQATLSSASINVSKASKVDKAGKIMYDNTNIICSNMITAVNTVHSSMSVNANDSKSYRHSAHVSVKKQSPIKAPTVSNSNIHNNEKAFVYNSVGTVAPPPPSSIAQPFYDNNSSRAVVSSGINFNSTTNRYNEYNTFNPFELPKTTQSFVKSYNEPAYVNNNCNYSYQSNTSDYNYQLAKNNYYDGNNCNFYNNVSNNNPNAANASNGNKYKKTKDAQTKSMVNWMAPDFSSSTAATVAKVTSSSYSDIAQNSYLNANVYSNEYQTVSSVSVMDTQPTHQEHQFPWSPTKLPQLLDTAQHFTPNTLPTLVGDLALGIGPYTNTTQVQSFDKQKTSKNKKQGQGYEPSNAGNILSVSQLVDHSHSHPKDTAQAVTGRIANRRNSGTATRSKSHQVNSKAIVKRHKDKEKTTKVCDVVDWDAKRSSSKNPISNYSAESLIAAKQQNYPKTIPPYMPDNILPYFPHNIDENFTQNNQAYHQNNTFTANYNNTFMPTSTSTTYLPTSNFIPDMFDPMENIFSHVNTTKGSAGAQSHKKNPHAQKNVNVNVGNVAPSIGNVTVAASAASAKNKSKKKESFVDLSFLNMPSINSPLLPEDFHANFLPPPPLNPNPNQLYTSCKNPINPINTMYKQSSGELTSILPLGSGASTVTSAPGSSVPAPGLSGVTGGHVPGLPGDNVRRAIQHPEISPAPGSLTNFNLCTIFPEINRTNSVVPDVFRNYGNNATTTQKSLNYLPNLE